MKNFLQQHILLLFFLLEKFTQTPDFWYYFTAIRFFIVFFRFGKFSPTPHFLYYFSVNRYLILFFNHHIFYTIFPIWKIFFDKIFYNIFLIWKMFSFTWFWYYKLFWPQTFSGTPNFSYCFPTWKIFSYTKFWIPFFQCLICFLFFRLGKYFSTPNFYTSFRLRKFSPTLNF